MRRFVGEGEKTLNTIFHTVQLNASRERLFDFHTVSKKHSAATGMKASVGRKAGAKWPAFNGMILGRNLVVIPNRMIVQTWGAAHWKKTDLDSILVLKFSKARPGGQLDLVHANLPDRDYSGVEKGLSKCYWKPWKACVSRK